MPSSHKTRSRTTKPGQVIPAGTVLEYDLLTWEVTATTTDGPVPARAVPNPQSPNLATETFGVTALLPRDQVRSTIDNDNDNDRIERDAARDAWARSLPAGTVLHEDHVYDRWIRGVALGNGTWQPTALVGDWLPMTCSDGTVGYSTYATEAVLASKPVGIYIHTRLWERPNSYCRGSDPTNLPEIPLTPWPATDPK